MRSTYIKTHVWWCFGKGYVTIAVIMFVRLFVPSFNMVISDVTIFVNVAQK